MKSKELINYFFVIALLEGYKSHTSHNILQWNINYGILMKAPLRSIKIWTQLHFTAYLCSNRYGYMQLYWELSECHFWLQVEGGSHLCTSACHRPHKLLFGCPSLLLGLPFQVWWKIWWTNQWTPNFPIYFGRVPHPLFLTLIHTR